MEALLLQMLTEPLVSGPKHPVHCKCERHVRCVRSVHSAVKRVRRLPVCLRNQRFLVQVYLAQENGVELDNLLFGQLARAHELVFAAEQLYKHTFADEKLELRAEQQFGEAGTLPQKRGKEDISINNNRCGHLHIRWTRAVPHSMVDFGGERRRVLFRQLASPTDAL